MRTKTAKHRIYHVNGPMGDFLVKAQTASQALRYITKKLVKVVVPTAEQLVALVQGGNSVEEAEQKGAE